GPEAGAVPPLRAFPPRPRPAAAAPPGAGTTTDPAGGHRVPTSPAPVPSLRRHHLRLAARGRADGQPRPAPPGGPRPDVGGLPDEQAHGADLLRRRARRPHLRRTGLRLSSPD